MPAGGGVAPGFSTQIIEIDFASWAATDFAAGGDGPYVLDGGSGNLTWTATNTAAANAGLATGGFFRRNAADVGDDGASGLRIFHDQNLLTSLNRGTQTGPNLTIPLSSLITGFDPTRSYLFELEINRFADNALVFTTASTACLALFGAAGTPAGSTARYSGAAMVRVAANNGSPEAAAGNATFSVNTALTYQAGTDVLAMIVGPAQNLTALAGAYGSTWPVATALTSVGVSSESIDNNATSALLQAASVLQIGVQSRQNNTGSIDVMFRRMRVLEGP